MEELYEESLRYSVLANGKFYKKDSRVWLHKSSANRSKFINPNHPCKNPSTENQSHILQNSCYPSEVSYSNDVMEDHAIRSRSFSGNVYSEPRLSPDSIKMANSCAAMIYLPHAPTNAEMKQNRKRRKSSSGLKTQNVSKTGKVLFIDENANFVEEFGMLEKLTHSLGFQPIKEEVTNSLSDELFPPPNDLEMPVNFWNQVMSEPSTDSTTWWRESKDIVASDSSSSVNNDGASPTSSPVPNKRHRIHKYMNSDEQNGASREIDIQDIEEDDHLVSKVDIVSPSPVFRGNNHRDMVQNTPIGSPWQDIFHGAVKRNH